MGTRSKASVAGVAGAAVAFGIVELVHGIYQGVPSVFLALAQTIIKLTPGGFATKAIETLGKADVPILVVSLVIGTLVVAVLLANLGLRSPTAALVGVGALGVIGVAASFTETFVAPIPTVIVIAGALVAGSAVAYFLLAAEVQEKKPATYDAEKPDGMPRYGNVRSRESGSSGGIEIGRRGFLALGGGATAVGLAAVGVGRLLGDGTQTAAAPKKLQALKESSGSGAKKVVHKTLPPPPKSASIEVPGMPKLITPAKNFYLIDTELSSPMIDASSWKLSVKGAVDNPIEISYKELMNMPTQEADITLSCVSNTVGGGLVSNGRWTGVLLSDVLKEAGVAPEKINKASEQLVGRSVDGWTAGFKTKLALDGREALVAFGLNGDQLPIKHGYPVRLVVPGLYGYVSATKWLSEIELTNWNFDAYWIQRTWAKKGPVKTESRIDTVKDGQKLSAGKKVPIGGVAWAPHRGISKVEVSTDDGKTWNNARLATQLDKNTWRQYVYNWEAKSGDHTLKVRATDGTGATQTSKTSPPHPSGAAGYDTVNVTVS
ncbi:MAG: molybdopterin-dependent oxidoreductase [Rubrobacteraceae bacterium]